MTVRIGDHRKSLGGGSAADREDLLVAHGNEYAAISQTDVDITGATGPFAFCIPITNEFVLTKAVFRETTAVADGNDDNVDATMKISVWNEGTATTGAADSIVSKNISEDEAEGVSNVSDLDYDLLDLNPGSYVEVEITANTHTNGAGVISYSVYIAEKAPEA